MLNAILIGRIGWTSVAQTGPGPVPIDWFEVLDIPLTDYASGAGNNTYRMRYKSPPMDGPYGERLRLRLRGSGGTQDTVVNQLWVGKVATGASGMPSGSAVQATFNGGSPAVVVPADGFAYSDPVSLVVDGETEDLVVSAFLTNVAQEVRRLSPAPSGTSGMIIAGNVASSDTSYGAGTGTVYLVDLIESDGDGEPVEPPPDPEWFTLTQPVFASGDFASWTNVVSRQIIAPARALRPQEGNEELRLTLRGKLPSGGATSVTAVRVSAVPKNQVGLDVGPDGWVTVLFAASGSVSVGENAFVTSDPFEVPGLGEPGKEALLVSMALNTFTVSSAPAIQGWRGGFLSSSSDVESTAAFQPVGVLQVLHSVEGFGQEPTPPQELQYSWGTAQGWNTGANSSGWDNHTIRQLIKQSAIGAPVGRWVRFRFDGRYDVSPNYEATISRAAVTTVPDAQTNWDVGSGGWVPITFGNGAGFGLAPVREGAWSDPVFLPNYGDTGHEALVVSFLVRGSVQQQAGNITGWTTAYRAGGDSVVTADSFTTWGNRIALTAVQTGLVGPEGDALAATLRRYVVMEFQGARAQTLRRYVVMEDI
jgi:hypothetical protein